MRFLHTSDWHLGRRLHGHDLSDAQQVAVDAIVDLAITRRVDALVIAGDVFDRAYPGVDDIRRFNRALARIHAAGIAIVCTAGNHDEGTRLATYAELLAEHVTVVGEITRTGNGIALSDDHGPVIVYPLPYLDPDAARRELAHQDGELLERSHEAVLTEAMRRITSDLIARRASDPTTRAVVVAHAFIVPGTSAQPHEEQPANEATPPAEATTPAEVTAPAPPTGQSDSERDITVGGVAIAPSSVFDGVDYVALGHLHGPRTIQEAAPTIRYSGSLLRYSISEADHVKSVTIVDLAADGTCSLEIVPIPQPAGMTRLHDDLDALLSDSYADRHDDFVEITLTDRLLPDNYLAQLRTRFTRILRTTREVPGRAVDATTNEGADADPDAVSPLDRLRAFYVDARGEDASPTQLAILRDALERAQRELAG